MPATNDVLSSEDASVAAETLRVALERAQAAGADVTVAEAQLMELEATAARLAAAEEERASAAEELNAVLGDDFHTQAASVPSDLILVLSSCAESFSSAECSERL